MAFLHHKIHRSKTCTCRASVCLLQPPSRHCHWSAEAGGGWPGEDKAVRKINTRFKKQTAKLVVTGRKPLDVTPPCFASALDTEDDGGHSTWGSSRRFRSRHSYLRVRLCGPRTRHLGHSGLIKMTGTAVPATSSSSGKVSGSSLRPGGRVLSYQLTIASRLPCDTHLLLLLLNDGRKDTHAGNPALLPPRGDWSSGGGTLQHLPGVICAEHTEEGATPPRAHPETSQFLFPWPLPGGPPALRHWVLKTRNVSSTKEAARSLPHTEMRTQTSDPDVTVPHSGKAHPPSMAF